MASPVFSAFSTAVLNPVYCETGLGSPAGIFAKQSVQDDAPRVTKPLPSHCNNDHSRIMEPLNFNQQPFNESSLDPLSCATQSPLPKGLPPVTRHMSCYARRAGPKFKPYQLGGKLPTALEHRFTTKNLLKRNEADLSLVDVHQVLSSSIPGHIILTNIVPGQRYF